jgi:hypothetical protein
MTHQYGANQEDLRSNMVHAHRARTPNRQFGAPDGAVCQTSAFS